MDFDTLRELCKQIRDTKGAYISNDPTQIIGQHGPWYLRAVLAVFCAALWKPNKSEFNHLFGFKNEAGSRKATELPQYLQRFHESHKHREAFLPRSDTPNLTKGDLCKDAKELGEVGFSWTPGG